MEISELCPNSQKIAGAIMLGILEMCSYIGKENITTKNIYDAVEFVLSDLRIVMLNPDKNSFDIIDLMKNKNLDITKLSTN